MTEPQVWVLIGVFATAIFGMIGIVTSSFNRTLVAAIGGVEAKIGGLEARIGGVEARIGGVEAKIGGVEAEIRGLREAMDAKFTAMDVKFTSKLEVLDKDIQALTRRAYGAEQS